MILSTTGSIPGKEISGITGIVRGSTVRARPVGRDFMAALKNIVGGEIEEYNQLQADAGRPSGFTGWWNSSSNPFSLTNLFMAG